MRVIFVLLCLCFNASASEALKQEPASKWLDSLSNSLRTLNFTTSFVVVKNNKAEPYHWYHGVNDEGVELEIFSSLNGPRKDILRHGEIVSYIAPDLPPYSINSEQAVSPIPSILRQDHRSLDKNYNVVSVGKSRVLGRSAQLIRIESKDDYRYGYWVWLDQHSTLLLKIAIVSEQGNILEQIQFTHLEISADLNENLTKLESTQLPEVIEFPQSFYENKPAWEVQWLPEGFNYIRSNKHRISLTKTPVEFMLFSDGLVDISVYVNTSAQQERNAEHVNDGATLALNQVNNGIEISVVGKIPASTAQAIANSIVFTTSKLATPQ